MGQNASIAIGVPDQDCRWLDLLPEGCASLFARDDALWEASNDPDSSPVDDAADSAKA